ncbi:carboxypeptidase regulatory-like domain-containing protein [Pedobacter sp. GSP4]|uniref:carboxypeptidase regulatory-like domain-containing protein n=1 Tax=Pedobacter sp. GSP4 TaxID=3453716 RepID=UPI003EECB9A9
MRAHFLLLLSIFCLGIGHSIAQTATAPPPSGTVKGIVRDTVHNYVLKAATVSIYKADNTVINYQLSNNYGEFKFSNLPIGQPLRLDISNVGYQTIQKNITIPKGQTLLDLKTVIINPQDVNLKEVTITVPPISYNNDTLEINAIAFKLDTNATVEDLLKKVPNITVWGDGIITVNGREVKQLTVNGKQFFGGDNKVALQNIPKNALEKIQIFNTADRNKPLDSNLVANLKLKKGKDRSYFGKISAGYGTDKHYQFDGNLNFSTPKLQLSVIGASNDVNKIPNDINTLIRNSTYKGVGTSVEYQSDFRQPGLNKGNVAGAQMIYNFTPDSKEWNNKSSLTADYYFKNLESSNIGDQQTITTINDQNQLYSNSSTTSFNTSDRHRFNSIYNYYKKSHRLDLSESFNTEKGENTSASIRSAENNARQLTSTNNGMSQNNFTSNDFSLRANYSYNNYNNWKQRFKNFNVSYDLTTANRDNYKTEITAFRDILNSANNQDFNRRYQTKNKNLSQNINVGIPNLKSVFFGTKNLSGFDAEINGKLNLATNQERNFIEDFVNNRYQQNAYLSNDLKTNVTDFTPGITLSKSFYKNLSNRYYKNLTINITAAQQYINQNNKSDRSFQNLKRSYTNFVPSVSINALNMQTGSYQESVNLNYRTTVRIPTIYQLAPLTDSTNLYNLQRGNINLKEELDRSINISFNHYDQKSKNTLNFGFYGSAGIVDNDIVDSTFIDQQNRRTVYLTNANGNKYANISGNIRKSIKFKTSELQLSYSTAFNFNKNPTFTNTLFNFSNNFSTNNTISTNFTYKDKLGIEASQGINTSQSKQTALGTKYKNLNLTTAISSNYNFTKKLSLSSNVNFNNNNPSVGESINFIIWNANATYRFTKGNNAEVKFSALDLLRQNQSILNFAGVNSFTTSSKNVLQQYFMVTLSYYPRKFGNNAAKK